MRTAMGIVALITAAVVVSALAGELAGLDVPLHAYNLLVAIGLGAALAWLLPGVMNHSNRSEARRGADDYLRGLQDGARRE